MRLVYTLLLPLAMSGCSSTGIVSTGPDTYMTARNGGRPSGLGAQISAQLYREATAYCVEQQKQFVKLALIEQDHRWFVRPPSARLEFRCAAPGDPALVAK